MIQSIQTRCLMSIYRLKIYNTKLHALTHNTEWGDRKEKHTLPRGSSMYDDLDEYPKVLVEGKLY
jgi:hypothetical protein